MLREFYVNLQRTAPLGNSQVVILQHFCCKWNEMLYIIDVIKLILLYIVRLLDVSYFLGRELCIANRHSPHFRGDQALLHQVPLPALQQQRCQPNPLRRPQLPSPQPRRSLTLRLPGGPNHLRLQGRRRQANR